MLAHLRHADCVEQCPSLRAKRKTYARIESGRALQVDFAELAVSGSASMYPAFDWSVWCSGASWISARACDLVNGQASTGHLGHQCSHAPGRPNLHLVSSSRRPRQVNRIIWLRHRGLLIFRALLPLAWNRNQADWFAA